MQNACMFAQVTDIPSDIPDDIPDDIPEGMMILYVY